MVLRLTGDEPVDRIMVCGESLTIEFLSDLLRTREELQYAGLQVTYADEGTGGIVLEIYTPEAQGSVSKR